MNNQDQKLKKLQDILEIMKNDTVTPAEIEKFLMLVLDVVKKTKVSFDQSAQNVLAEMKDAVIFSQVENSSALKKVDERNAQALKSFDDKIQQIEKLIEDFKKIKPKDGDPGKPADEQKIVSDVLAKIPPVISKTAEQERDDLESLVDDERLDVSAVKGTEELIDQKIGAVNKGGKIIGVGNRMFKVFNNGVRVGGNVRELNFIDADSIVSPGKSGNRVNITTGGSSGGSANIATEKLTATQSGSNVTLDLTQLSNTFSVIQLVTRQGQILTPTTSYSVSGNTATIFNADASEDFMVQYTYGSPPAVTTHLLDEAGDSLLTEDGSNLTQE